MMLIIAGAAGLFVNTVILRWLLTAIGETKVLILGAGVHLLLFTHPAPFLVLGVRGHCFISTQFTQHAPATGPNRHWLALQRLEICKLMHELFGC